MVFLSEYVKKNIDSGAFLIETKGVFTKLARAFLFYRNCLKPFKYETLKRQDLFADPPSPQTALKQVRIDREKMSVAIIARAKSQLENFSYDYRPTEILMGLKQFSELMADADLMNLRSKAFDFDIMYKMQRMVPNDSSHDGERLVYDDRYKVQCKLLNLNVKIVPHMDGVLVL